jgi:transposase-like protein
MSKDQVTRLCRGLDEQVSVFRERPLAGAYPYLWLDAKVGRIREPGGCATRPWPTLGSPRLHAYTPLKREAPL